MLSTQISTVISGKLGDCDFNQACFIAEYLNGNLPNFRFKKISKTPSEWKQWLKMICLQKNWSHSGSPLIWRSFGLMGIQNRYIGGIKQFWKLLIRYYNVTCYLSEKDLKSFNLDMLYAFNAEIKLYKKISKIQRRITIIGAGRSVCSDLVPQLLVTKELWLSDGIIVNLYDDSGHFFKMGNLVKDLGIIGAGLDAARIIHSLDEGLKDCDILIYLNHLEREDNEYSEKWLLRNYHAMRQLSSEINQHAPSHMRLILCSMGPDCYCVNVLHNLVKKISEQNIISVSAHYGLECVYTFVTSLGFEAQDFGCPPVWGFLGVNHFIDINHMVYRYNQTSDDRTNISNSEFRWFFHMSHDKNPYKHQLERKTILHYQLGRTEDLQKCRAICDLLKLWYNQKTDDEIISLGISSDGSFGIPKGLVFSQPVYLKRLEDDSLVWTPLKEFPMPNIPMEIFENLIYTAKHLVEKIPCQI